MEWGLEVGAFGCGKVPGVGPPRGAGQTIALATANGVAASDARTTIHLWFWLTVEGAAVVAARAGIAALPLRSWEAVTRLQ